MNRISGTEESIQRIYKSIILIENSLIQLDKRLTKLEKKSFIQKVIENLTLASK